MTTARGEEQLALYRENLKERIRLNQQRTGVFHALLHAEGDNAASPLSLFSQKMDSEIDEHNNETMDLARNRQDRIAFCIGNLGQKIGQHHALNSEITEWLASHSPSRENIVAFHKKMDEQEQKLALSLDTLIKEVIAYRKELAEMLANTQTETVSAFAGHYGLPLELQEQLKSADLFWGFLSDLRASLPIPPLPALIHQLDEQLKNLEDTNTAFYPEAQRRAGEMIERLQEHGSISREEHLEDAMKKMAALQGKTANITATENRETNPVYFTVKEADFMEAVTSHDYTGSLHPGGESFETARAVRLAVLRSGLHVKNTRTFPQSKQEKILPIQYGQLFNILQAAALLTKAILDSLPPDIATPQKKLTDVLLKDIRKAESSDKTDAIKIESLLDTFSDLCKPENLPETTDSHAARALQSLSAIGSALTQSRETISNAKKMTREFVSHLDQAETESWQDDLLINSQLETARTVKKSLVQYEKETLSHCYQDLMSTIGVTASTLSLTPLSDKEALANILCKAAQRIIASLEGDDKLTPAASAACITLVQKHFLYFIDIHSEKVLSDTQSPKELEALFWQCQDNLSKDILTQQQSDASLSARAQATGRQMFAQFFSAPSGASLRQPMTDEMANSMTQAMHIATEIVGRQLKQKYGHEDIDKNISEITKKEENRRRSLEILSTFVEERAVIPSMTADQLHTLQENIATQDSILNKMVATETEVRKTLAEPAWTKFWNNILAREAEADLMKKDTPAGVNNEEADAMKKLAIELKTETISFLRENDGHPQAKPLNVFRETVRAKMQPLQKNEKWPTLRKFLSAIATALRDLTTSLGMTKSKSRLFDIPVTHDQIIRSLPQQAENTPEKKPPSPGGAAPAA